MGLGNLLGNVVKGTLGQKKAQGQITQLKKQYLRVFPFEQLKELCNQKGISTFTQQVNPNLGQQTVQSNPLGFYEIVDLVSTKINSQEIIYFAKQQGLTYQDFETKLNQIKAFYKMN